jgi:hypothetical protein
MSMVAVSQTGLASTSLKIKFFSPIFPDTPSCLFTGKRDVQIRLFGKSNHGAMIPPTVRETRNFRLAATRNSCLSSPHRAFFRQH